MIHVLILVAYDYYRFQEVVDASSVKADMRKAAKELNKRSSKSPLPVEDYKPESNEQVKYDAAEVRHYWIQTIRPGQSLRRPRKAKLTAKGAGKAR